MFLVTGQMETNLKGVEFFEILDGYHFLLSIPPPTPKHISKASVWNSYLLHLKYICR